ncbi:MAG: DUF3566 domain-containing protein [Jatrophihabitans sp.]
MTESRHGGADPSREHDPLATTTTLPAVGAGPGPDSPGPYDGGWEQSPAGSHRQPPAAAVNSSGQDGVASYRVPEPVGQHQPVASFQNGYPGPGQEPNTDEIRAALTPGAPAAEPMAAPMPSGMPAGAPVAAAGGAVAGAAGGARAARPAKRAAASRGPRRTGERAPRRAHLQLKHIDVWSVLKLSCVLSFALFFVWLVVVGVLYGVLDATGVFDKVNQTAQTVNDNSKDVVTPSLVLGGALVIGVIDVVLFIVLSTIGSVVYNLCSDLVGGVELTLSERD